MFIVAVDIMSKNFQHEARLWKLQLRTRGQTDHYNFEVLSSICECMDAIL
jgi:hypothetical protein